MPDATPTAAERFATLARCLCLALAAQAAGGRLSLALIGLISGRIISINLCVGRIVARIAAGRFTPRRATIRRKSPVRQARRPSALPTRYGWLLPLLPDATSFRSQLEHLLRDPEMAALLQAAPAALARPIRSLCWALWLPPPPILAPARPATPPAPAATPDTARPRQPPALPPPRRRASAPKSRPPAAHHRPHPA